MPLLELQVKREVIHQAWRLGSHPSVALWGGYNEVEASFDSFSETQAKQPLYAVDYSKLFVDTIFAVSLRKEGGGGADAQRRLGISCPGLVLGCLGRAGLAGDRPRHHVGRLQSIQWPYQLRALRESMGGHPGQKPRRYTLL